MNDGYWRLSLTRKTIYTLEQLHLQNTKFNKLSIEKGIEIYDGWDIEPTT